ncbi:outer membrane beta-barrel protein [Cytophagaceae bacterium DM2B3-1]|uniref:Outer membrane beta-barrel protein n=1 Tax=Xanthocytophaga flava TaxID=3048013 RepID=A0ABT7CW39_9BACT|nr:outer membrane beta-barrel protein [Xanthocytophaga flavus]MDJ1473322.1 outer membrane beta-barrel protein [Xanthocytophaga flavus]MDJ1497721.1 outer membrane beta-barrel protein [Xanthocytophaga flavus]
MRKNVALFLAVFTVWVATGSLCYCQTDKGTFMVGGSIGNLSFQSDYLGVSFSPTVGYFVVTNLVVGLTPAFEYKTFTLMNDSKTKSTSFGIGPFVRYYFGEGKLKPLLNASFLYYRNTVKLGDLPIDPNDPVLEGDHKVKQGYKFIQLGGGIAYFLSKSIALEGIVNYGHYMDYDILGSNKSNEVAVSLGFQIFLD